jgi:hypothetical protein
MNGNGNGNANGRGKTLLPEFLPAPRATETQSPPERVAARARILLQRFRGLGTAASAALLSLNCNNGYMVVDPLPPPAVACTSSPDPFATILANVMFAPGDGGASPPIVLVLATAGYPPGNLTGFSIAAVRVTDGTVLTTQDLTGDGRSTFLITIAPAAATGTILVDVDLTCSSQARTKHYSIAYSAPASAGGTLVVTELSPVDAGTD